MIIYEKLKSSLLMGNFVIVYTQLINENQFVVFTELSYVDYDNTVLDEMGNVKKKAFHNFLFNYDKNLSELSILSDLFSDTTSKFQKEEFIQKLFAGNSE